MTTTTYTQTFYEASDGAGDVRRFYVNVHFQDSEQRHYALEWAGSYGYAVKFGRNRLNDYVGSPVWSDAELIEEL